MSFFSFKSKSKLGIDIGTSAIKIVELSKEGGRFKLDNYGMFQLEAVGNAVNISNKLSSESVAQLTNDDLSWGIKEIIKVSKMKASDAVVSIPSFSSFSTMISMPYLSEKDIAKSIPFEARKYIPLPISDVILDWSIVNIANNQQGQMSVQQPNNGGLGKTPTVDVFLIAVPKQEIERYKSIIKITGLNFRALEPENSALIRALLGNDLSPVAIVNIGGRSTSILIVDNGYERISHNYEVGGFEITRSISKALNVSISRAEELKRSIGIKDVEDNVIQQAMSSLLDMMALETKKTMHSYEELKNTKVSKVILVGGLANMPNFANYFGNRLGVPVTVGNPLSRLVLPEGLKKIQPELNNTFPISIGLAMREF